MDLRSETEQKTATSSSKKNKKGDLESQGIKIIQYKGRGPTKRTKTAAYDQPLDFASEAKDPLKDDLAMDEASVISDKTSVVVDETTTFITESRLTLYDLYTTLEFWKRINQGWYCMILHLVAILFRQFLQDPWFVVDAAMLRSHLPQATKLAKENLGILWAPNPESQSILLYL